MLFFQFMQSVAQFGAKEGDMRWLLPEEKLLWQLLFLGNRLD